MSDVTSNFNQYLQELKEDVALLQSYYLPISNLSEDRVAKIKNLLVDAGILIPDEGNNCKTAEKLLELLVLLKG